MSNEFHISELCHRFSRQIVKSRSKTAGDQDDFRAIGRRTNGFSHRIKVVGDRQMCKNLNTNFSQLKTEPLTIGIEFGSRRQFCSDGYNFCVHRKTFGIQTSGRSILAD